MNKRSWFIPVLIIAVNVLAIVIRWSSLAEIVPAHFDLEGNASGSMPRMQLLMFPLISAVVLLICNVVARLWQKLQKGMVVLTQGTMPIFMLAEPVVLLAAVVGSVVCIRHGK